MDEQRSPADRLLDLVVFGPAGLALTAAEEFPKLVDKGRNHLEGQVRTARLVGQVAVQMGRRQLDSLVSQRTTKAPTAGPGGARSAGVSAHAPAPASASPSADSGVTSASPGPSGHQTDDAAVPSGVNGHGPLPVLAIPGYDSLSASQVVQRLAGLSSAELADVRAHEQSHRHRRTILNRVEQLLAGVDAE